jgi:hypothetical protein
LKKFTNRSKILGIIFTLVILAALVVPAMPVSAAQDYPLEVIGYSTVSISKVGFEAMATSNPSPEFTETSTPYNIWRGLPLWRLIAQVDGGDPETLNSSVTYNLKFTASDGYSKTINYADFATAFNFANNNNIFVANEVNVHGTTGWTDLPLVNPDNTSKLWFPLKISGSGLTAGNQSIGALVKIELLNLPMPAVNVSAQSQSVANGATFNEALNINTDTASRGWGATVTFDPAKLTANSVSEGTFLSGWASGIGHGMGTVSGGAADIDNVAGTITIPGYAITGTYDLGGPTGSGVLCTISFTAKAAADNSSAIITPSVVTVKDVNSLAIPGVTTSNGTLGIGNFPMADLVVSSAFTTKVTDDTYTITYTVTNNGNDTTGVATNTNLVIDGGAPISIACPVLAGGASDTQTTTAQTLTSTSDTIVISADSSGAVAESNETNNSRTVNYSLGPIGEGDTVIDGNINAKLEFTAPSDIDSWLMDVGANTNNGSMNVKCNADWQVKISDANNAGHMAKWNGSFAVPTVALADALKVTGTEPQVTLSGTPQTIATGTPSGQIADSGDDVAVTYDQTVHYADPVLSGGYSYHIILTFGASVTF